MPKQETGRAVEVTKDGIKKKRGRPSKGSVRAKPPVVPKRAYNKKTRPHANVISTGGASTPNAV